MSSSNKFKNLFPNYKDSMSSQMTRPEYRDQELKMKKNPFGKVKQLFNRRKRKKDQEHY